MPEIALTAHRPCLHTVLRVVHASALLANAQRVATHTIASVPRTLFEQLFGILQTEARRRHEVSQPRLCFGRPAVLAHRESRQPVNLLARGARDVTVSGQPELAIGRTR